ncbi:hypothetical protein ABT023_16175 [Micromonospora sp. NPDC002296]|uniref:hypothetical protein n=1 Tax=Micromonospora sp. NPDC002296 TaxID=3154271 RepID=UPI00332303E9
MMKPLSWIGFAIAVIGGAGLVGVGLAAAVQIIAVLAALIIIGIDIAKDGQPDQYAVIGAFVLPSLIVGINGAFPDWLSDKLADLWGWAEDNMGDWVGTTTVGLALAAVVVSFLVSTRAQGLSSRKGR